MCNITKISANNITINKFYNCYAGGFIFNVFQMMSIMTLEEESYELCKYLFERYLKNEPNRVVAITEDFQVNVSFKITRCMLDGKLRGICSGRSATHCFSCPWTLDDYCNKNKHQAVTVHCLKYDHGDENIVFDR